MALGMRESPAPTSSHEPHHSGAFNNNDDDVSVAWTVEAAALATKKAIQGQAATLGTTTVTTMTTTVEVGKATPIVVPIFAALKRAKDTLDGAKRHKVELEDLHDHCIAITAYFIVRCNSPQTAPAAACKADADTAAPLADCLEALRELAGQCSVEGSIPFAKLGRRRRESDRISRLGDRIEALVLGMGLVAVVRVSEEEEGAERARRGGGDVSGGLVKWGRLRNLSKGRLVRFCLEVGRLSLNTNAHRFFLSLSVCVSGLRGSGFVET